MGGLESSLLGTATNACVGCPLLDSEAGRAFCRRRAFSEAKCHAKMSLRRCRPKDSPNCSAFPGLTQEVVKRIRVSLTSCEMLRKISGTELAERVGFEPAKTL